MYQVFLDEHVLYIPGDDEAVLIDPVLELALGKSGTFSARVPKINPLYEKLKALDSTVRVELSLIHI